MEYDPHTGTSKDYFATVQTKMHWAAHGHTAAEVIALRANATAPRMGLTNWPGAGKGSLIRKADVVIAKNYLNEQELDSLNRIVNAYIELAELQAQARRIMHMRDWAQRLDDFLKMTERDVLSHAGKVSAAVAQTKAQVEFEQYKIQQLAAPSSAERDFEEAIAKPVKAIAGKAKPSMVRRKSGERGKT